MRLLSTLVIAVSLALMLTPGVGTDSNIIEFYFNGALVGSITGVGVGATNTSWSLHNYSFTATGPSSTIMFLASGISDGLGGFIDDVQFRATSYSVPEPSTLILLGSALLGVCGLVWLVGYIKKRGS